MESRYIHKLIRMEEDVDFNSRQETLFHRFFDISELKEVAMCVRWIIDATVQQISGKPFDANSERIHGFTKIDHYPLGFCDDITHSVEVILKWGTLESIASTSSTLSKNVVHRLVWSEQNTVFSEIQRGLSKKISEFEEAGGVFGPVWGIMPHESCFQWFILAGSYIVNVANDALNRHTYPVDVTKRESHRYRSIQDYSDYIKIAETYLGLTIYRNTLIPSIAPVCPIVAIDQRGNIHFSRPTTLTLRSVKTGYKLSKNIYESEELANPPSEFETMFQKIWFPKPVDNSDPFENWKNIIKDSPETTGEDVQSMQIQRANYLARSAEYDWYENFDFSLGRGTLGIGEKNL